MGELRYLIEQLTLAQAMAGRVEGGEMLVYLIDMALVEARDRLLKLERQH